MKADDGMFLRRQLAGLDQTVAFGDPSQFGEQACVEDDFIEPVENILRRRRNILAHQRIELDDQDVAHVGFIRHGLDRRIGDIAAVPIALAVDQRRLEHLRQSGRGEQDVGVEFMFAKNPQGAGRDMGGVDEELDAVLADEPARIGCNDRASRAAD